MEPLMDAAFYKKARLSNADCCYGQVDKMAQIDAVLAWQGTILMANVEVGDNSKPLDEVILDSMLVSQDETMELEWADVRWATLALYDNATDESGAVRLLAPIISIYTRAADGDPFSLYERYLLPMWASYIMDGESFDASGIRLLDISSQIAGNVEYIDNSWMNESGFPLLLLLSSSMVEEVPASDEAFAVQAMATGATIYSRNSNYANLGLNPYMALTLESATLYMAQIMQTERQQTKLVLINLVATLIASDGLRQMIALKADHEDWSSEQYIQAYTTELAARTVDLLTAMGAMGQIDEAMTSTIARAIAGYVYVWAVNTGWKMPGGMDISGLLDSQVGSAITRQIPAQITLMQRELAAAVNTFVTDARQARKAAENSSALATTGAVVSAAKLLL